MLVNCPECHSPVFVRSAAIEQRKPQRCYACKAQLLVTADGTVDIAVSGKREAAPGMESDGPTLISPPPAAASAKAVPGPTAKAAPVAVPKAAPVAAPKPAPASVAKAPAAGVPRPPADPDATHVTPPGAQVGAAPTPKPAPFGTPQPAPAAPAPAFDPDATRVVGADALAAAPAPAAFDPDATRVVAEATAPPPAPAFDPDATRIVAEATAPPPAPAFDPDATRIVPPSSAAEPTRPLLSRDPRAYGGDAGPRPVTMVTMNLEVMERQHRERQAKERAAMAAKAAADGPAPVTLDGLKPPALTPSSSMPDYGDASWPSAEEDDTAVAPDPRKPLAASLRSSDPSHELPTTIPAASQAATSLLDGDGMVDLAAELSDSLEFDVNTYAGPLTDPWPVQVSTSPPAPAPQSPTAPKAAGADPWFSKGTLVKDIPEELLRAAIPTGEYPRPPPGGASPDAASSAKAPEPVPAGLDPDAYWDGSLEKEPTAAEPRFSDRPLEDLFEKPGVLLGAPSVDDLPTVEATELLLPDEEATLAGTLLPRSDEEPPLVAGSLLEQPAALGVEELELPDPASAPEPTAAWSAQDFFSPPPDPAPDAAAPAAKLPFPDVDEPYSIQPPLRQSGGALAWAAALGLGLVVGLGGAYLFPAAELSPIEQKLAAANDLLGKGQPAEASAVLDEVLAEQPDHADAVRGLAISASLAGDALKAERHYLRYLTLSDDEADKSAVRALLGL